MTFPHFLNNHVHLQDGGGRRFEPWAWQLEVARLWEAHPRVIVLKARQLGVSWMAAAFALWTALHQPGAHVLLVSQTAQDAEELLGKVRFIYERLPDALRPASGRDNLLLLEFPELHARIQALPSTHKAGRGKTAALVIADEHAFHPFAEANLAALAPTVEAGGRLLIISTANGLGNTFATLWSRSSPQLTLTREVPSGPTPTPTPTLTPTPTPAPAPPHPHTHPPAHPHTPTWLGLFLPYHLHPDRDAAWYARREAEYPRPWMLHQEYPRDAEESFVQTGRPVFSKEILGHQRGFLRPPLPHESWPAPLRAHCRPEELRVFELPRLECRYIAGADVAEGLDHGDYSDLAVLRVPPFAGEPFVEVLSLHGHWPPDLFAGKIDAVARLYPGLYGVERNNHGLAVVVALQRLGTPGLYYEKPVVARYGAHAEPGRPGWLTTAISKPLLIDHLETAVRTQALHLSDESALPEFAFYQTRADGSTGAAEGQYDDRVISRGIAVQMGQRLSAYKPAEPDPGPPPPQRFAPETW